MTYFQSSDIPRRKLLPLIGEETKTGVRGSTTYFIKSFQSAEQIDLMEDSKGIFQLFSKGLLLRIFKNNRSISLPIPFDQIKRLELTKGEEVINPFFLSAMWVLLKLGVKIEIARYFKSFRREYGIKPSALEIETDSFKLRLETNGYTFNSQADFFSKLTEVNGLKIDDGAAKHAH